MNVKELTVTNKAGFHIRVASLVCKAANKYQSAVTVSKGSYEADAKSCMDLLALMCPQGETLTVKAEGDDEDQAMAEIASLFEHKFYEDEFESQAPSDL